MTDTAIFSFARADDDIVDIRTTLIDGEPWFVAADICRALGLAPNSSTNGAGARARYGAGDIQTIRKGDVLSVSPTLTSLFSGSASQVALLSESGLYKLLMRSEKKEAVAFQDWIASEVLPSIRKTGQVCPGRPQPRAMPLLMDIAEEQSWLQQIRSLLGSIIRADIYKREASEIPPWGSPSVILEVPQGLRGHVLYLSTRRMPPPRSARGSSPAFVARLCRRPKRVDAKETFRRDTASVPYGLTWCF